ncbi:hypothetical protein [Leptobacterium sp. I13]|uniref:hypothetical protein n=1 Tax=Leptobacterium meishanense TaxID=3128904 RepID=UPI0030EF62F3
MGSASNAHYNRNNSPSEEVALVSSDGYKKIDSLTLFIPSNLDMDKMLELYPPNFRYQRDCFIYVIHEVIAVAVRNRDKVEDMSGFTPIKREYLQRRIHGYKKYVNYLVERKVLEQNNIYVPGKQSMGLRLSSKYRGGIVRPIQITKWTLIKNIVYLNINYNEGLTNELIILKKWFNPNLTIDAKNGLRFLKKEYRKDVRNPEVKFPHLRLTSRSQALQKLHQGEITFIVDNSGQRLHTNLTPLMSGLRKFVKYDSENLCAIDIKNSQPYLSTSLLSRESFLKNNMTDKIINPYYINQDNYPIMIVDFIDEIENKPDVLQFKEMVSSGLFYEKFGSALIKKELINKDSLDIRKQAKDITFRSIFSPNTSVSYSESIKLFKEAFPNVYKIFKMIKKGRGNHNTLAIALQRLEANLVLKKTCMIVSKEKPEAPLFTIHDSIVTTPGNVEYVEKILYNILNDNIGLPPNLKREYWV